MHTVIAKSPARCGHRATRARIRQTTGAVALLSILCTSASAEEYRWGGSVQTARPGVETPSAYVSRPGATMSRQSSEPARARAEIAPVLRESQVTSLKVALNLKPSQQQYWVPVEAALHALVHQQARDAASGVFQRLSDRSSALAVTAMQLRRLRAVATPLINTLDDNQRREAIKFARHMGYGQLVASF